MNKPATQAEAAKNPNTAGKISQKEIDRVLEGGVVIPPRPEILTQIEEMARNEDIDLRSVAQLISKDVGLSAAVFRLAGSPIFGLRKKPATIEQAIPVLGLRQTTSIIRSESLRKAVSGASYPKAYAALWDRFNEIGLLTAIITDSLKIRSISPEQAFTAGMFCDCGIPILMNKLPGYCAALKQNDALNWPAIPEEDDKHNTSHTVVGHLVARNWKLPDLITEAIRDHHDVENASPGTRQLIAALQFALRIHDLINRRDGSEWYAHREFVLTQLDIAESEEKEIAEEAMEQFHYAS